MRLLAIVRADRTALTVLRIHLLRTRARGLFPGNESLQEKWVQARLRLRMSGCRRPRVPIACRPTRERITAPRTLREAGIHGARQ